MNLFIYVITFICGIIIGILLTIFYQRIIKPIFCPSEYKLREVDFIKNYKKRS